MIISQGRMSLWTRFLWLFQQNTEDTAFLLGGGQQESFELNRWAIAGFGIRQTVQLKQGIFYHSGPKGDVTLNLKMRPSMQEAKRSLFEELESARQQARFWDVEAKALDLPLAGGLAGALAYSFYQWCDEGWSPSLSEQPAEAKPDLLLYEFKDWLLLDLISGHLHVLSESPTRKRHYAELWDMSQIYATQEHNVKNFLGKNWDRNAYLQNFKPSFSPEQFENGVDEIKGAIQRGELYQANLSMRLEKSTPLEPIDLFKHLSHQNPSPFSGFFRWPGGAIVSNSPERLLQVDRHGHAQTRPIAGTRGRGQTEEEDAAIAQTLLGNEKELAEHRMLVDLARNDLGRVCQSGSVEIDAMLAIERYAHVTHLVSNVVGQVSPEKTPWEVLQALFPGGTITGCPKIRCVDILQSLEPVSRGFYTGSLGYINARGPAMDWNILIRSVFFETNESASLSDDETAFAYNAAIHVGAGIVQDAVGAYEYRECMRKAATNLDAFAYLEQQQLSPYSMSF